MSLYYDAAKFLVSSKDHTGSLKSRVFGSKDLKSSPKQVFALIAEASRWSPILADVIDKSQLLQHERKLNPSLALLLVHDLLLAKSGIAALATHPLRLAVIRHKARLSAELTKVRIRRGFGSIDEFRGHLASVGMEQSEENLTRISALTPKAKQLPHPRWVRINTLKTTLETQLETTLAGYEQLSSLAQMLVANPSNKTFHVDEHIPNLIALPPGTDLSKTAAYRSGLIILQDKASCFPAHLLDPKPEDGIYLDVCAAPGNKTTQLAAILQGQTRRGCKTQLWACERDKARAEILTRLVVLAGCEDIVIVKAGQDFLLLNPEQAPWKEVGSLLLDPSCSGSGIIGRDETLEVTLPSASLDTKDPHKTRKRKRNGKTDTKPVFDDVRDEDEESIQMNNEDGQLSKRLQALSAFQLRLLLHAFRFPNARRLSYSTCSVYAEENEHVIIAGLQSAEAKQFGWHLLGRDEQIIGLKSWPIRGDVKACQGRLTGESTGAEFIAEACIRCRPGTEEGTQGFFVAAFVRRAQESSTNGVDSNIHQSEQPNVESLGGTSLDVEVSDDWNGFSDTD
ncbi:MAG: hypothetical protein Q9166_008209 [cf. Caloplaca sp. 2 TL-2023]